MATLYVSYHKDDAPLAKALKDALAPKGHDVRLDAGGADDDVRRDIPGEDLASSDAVLVLLSERALASHYVPAELGAARALRQVRGVQIIPVIVGDMRVPQIVADLNEARVRDPASPQDVAASATSIDRELKRQSPPSKWPSIFISHSHKDRDVAEALTDLLDANFRIGKGDIRCTSVRTYQLPVGERTSDRLRAEVSHAKVVLGIVTPDTKESVYVMFELGASWGQQISAWPLLAKGATESDVPAPIRDVNYVQLSDDGECQRLINDLSNKVALQLREDALDRVPQKASVLAGLARRAEGVAPAASKKGASKRKGASKKRPEKKSASKKSASKKGVAKKGAKPPASRARKASKKGAADALDKRLKELLKDPEYPNGRYLSTLRKKTGLSKSDCRERLLKLGARKSTLKNGEGWKLKRRK